MLIGRTMYALITLENNLVMDASLRILNIKPLGTSKAYKTPLKYRIIAFIFHDFEALGLFGALGTTVPSSDYHTLKLLNLHNLPLMV